MQETSLRHSPDYNQSISGNLTTLISDHYAQFLIIPHIDRTGHHKQIKFKRDTSGFNNDRFIEEFNAIDWSLELKYTSLDINKSFTLLEQKINSIIDKHMPLRKLTKKEIKLKKKPWITNEIRAQMRKRDKKHRKFLKTKNREKRDELYINFKEFRNKVVALCRASKKSYFRNYFSENCDNSKKTWQGIKSIINIKPASKSELNSLLIDNEISTDPVSIANSFNNYFSSIARKLQAKIYPPKEDFSTYLKNRNEHSLFIIPTDKYEVMKIIDNIDITKATGPHSIPSNILPIIKEIVSDPIANIVNMSFDQGKYIDVLKLAEAIPVFKGKGSNLESFNFRPISLLSNINKIFEKLMHSRLYNFLSTYNCIYNLQFGFRKQHSTIHALIDITENIRKALDNNEFAVGVFIDLQKAFDTVDHKILLKKLEHYGIRGIVNKWFESYLANRMQFVKIKGCKSYEALMVFGVPQGSILGPLLFLIYINDIHEALKYSIARLFADDSNLLINNKCLKKIKKYLNFDLRFLSRWLRANKISLNAAKTELIIFRHPIKQLNYDLKVKIEGKKLYPSEFVKYLGVLIDCHLRWNYHIDFIAPKLSRALGMLTKVRNFVDSKTLRSVYFGIFSSIMFYGALVWGQLLNKHVNRILRLQDRAIRVLNFASYNDSRGPLYKKMRILKFTDYVYLQNFLFVHDSFEGKLPTVFNDYFMFSNKQHNYHNNNNNNNNNNIFISS